VAEKLPVARQLWNSVVMEAICHCFREDWTLTISGQGVTASFYEHDTEASNCSEAENFMTGQ
jgi:hypothetical protein